MRPSGLQSVTPSVFQLALPPQRNDRSIEGENPLYLPQAKTYERCMGLGPCLYIPAAPIDPDSELTLEIKRDGKSVRLPLVEFSPRKKPRHLERVSPRIWGNERAVWGG